ncbi:molybdopterin converting factor subunit 1 [Paenibacillus sp.]|uniref:molybdopterin converting factor subunit 1 n=1 Tax=Paenibacillus sp. TaxID=58172 RepID=UPI002D3E134A|nr:molybdopterin converting factor subunit 1 [Paenibacillus sp.]HZG88225.1 molybdopterin converting factor subunit 1 [Paenibacillus sp.]
MNILLFAGLAEAVGAATVRLNVELPASVADAKKALADAYPEAAKLLDSCFAAINHAYANDDAVIRPGDEVAFLPPVSGG